MIITLGHELNRYIFLSLSLSRVQHRSLSRVFDLNWWVAITSTRFLSAAKLLPFVGNALKSFRVMENNDFRPSFVSINALECLIFFLFYDSFSLSLSFSLSGCRTSMPSNRNFRLRNGVVRSRTMTQNFDAFDRFDA